jgi:Outer membrane protein beta-barrel domain
MPIRISITLYLFVILSSAARAQVRVGIKVGPDFARLLDAVEGYNGSGGTTLLNTDSRTYLYGGVFADIPLGKGKENMFYLRPQLEYMEGGGQLPMITDYNGNALVLATKYSLHYIDLPVQFLFSPTLPIGRPWIGAGLYGGVLLSGTAKYENTSYHLSIGNSDNDAIERYDFGFSLTAGLTLKCGILIGGDFQQGLIRVSPPSLNGASASRPNTRNSIGGVHIGYEFTLK